MSEIRLRCEAHLPKSQRRHLICISRGRAQALERCGGRSRLDVWEGRERCELRAPSGIRLTPTPGGAALTQPLLLRHGFI